MRAYECDICGKFYKLDNYFEKRKDDTSLRIKFRNRECIGVTNINTGTEFDGSIHHSGDFDICPECVKALNDFIRERTKVNVPG